MKKILLGTALLAIPFLSSAQEGFKYGGKLGLNMANIVGTDLFEVSSKTGLHIGPIAHYGFGDEGNFSVIGELLFDMKGAKYGDDPLALNYLTIPIMPRYRFNFGMYLETGIYLGFLMGASIDGESSYDDVDADGNTISRNVKDRYEGMDFGYTVGIGYIHESGIGIGYRYNLGLKDIHKPVEVDGFGDIDIDTNIHTVGQISLMYYLNWTD